MEPRVDGVRTAAASGRKRILVVNDDPAILDVFRDLLEDEGYEPILDTLRTGNIKALSDRVEEDRPDAVVLDFLIGGEQLGWQALQLLKMQPKTADVPVIVCTAAVDTVKELGAHLAKLKVEVVLKPFEIDDLYSAIARALDVEGHSVSPNGPPSGAREGSRPSAWPAADDGTYPGPKPPNADTPS